MGPRKVAVLIDSNTLILMAKGVIAPSMIEEAVQAPANLATTSAVVREIERLAELHKGRALGRQARTALSLLDRLQIAIIESSMKDADDSLEEAARMLRTSGDRVYVATSDRALRRRLRLAGIPTVYLRSSEGRLEADWVDAL